MPPLASAGVALPATATMAPVSTVNGPGNSAANRRAKLAASLTMAVWNTCVVVMTLLSSLVTAASARCSRAVEVRMLIKVVRLARIRLTRANVNTVILPPTLQWRGENEIVGIV